MKNNTITINSYLASIGLLVFIAFAVFIGFWQGLTQGLRHNPKNKTYFKGYEKGLDAGFNLCFDTVNSILDKRAHEPDGTCVALKMINRDTITYYLERKDEDEK